MFTVLLSNRRDASHGTPSLNGGRVLELELVQLLKKLLTPFMESECREILRFSRRWSFNSRFSGLWRRVVLIPSSHWGWRQHGLPKLCYPTTTLHGFTTQQTSTWIWIFSLPRSQELATGPYL